MANGLPLEECAPRIDPRDVVHDPCLTRDDKRALLAFWASDVHAVPDAPALRRLETGAIVEIDDVLEALKALDERPAPTAWGEALRAVPRSQDGRRRRRVAPAWRRLWRRDDDDDLPPVPAGARPPRPAPLADAVALSAS